MPQLDTIRSSITNREGDVSVDVEIVCGVLKIFNEELNSMSDISIMYIRGRSLS